MTRIPTKLNPWFEARRCFKLSHAHTQMARELGMNPRKLGSLADGGQEPWKLPLPEFIVECWPDSRKGRFFQLIYCAEWPARSLFEGGGRQRNPRFSLW